MKDRVGGSLWWWSEEGLEFLRALETWLSGRRRMSVMVTVPSARHLHGTILQRWLRNVGCFRNCLVVSKSEGYIDEEIVSVLSPCLGLHKVFLWARHPATAELIPRLCLQQYCTFPKPPWFPHSNPLFHPLSCAPCWSSPCCRCLAPGAIIPLPSQHHLLSPFYLFSELVPLFFFQLDDIFCWLWLLLNYIG